MRNTVRLLVVVFCFSMLGALCTNARADEWDKKTILTFSGPVTVAGHRLEAGTYVFKLADTADRHVVQIFNEREDHVYATILAIPDYRLEPTGKTVIKFSETLESNNYAGNLPEAGVPIKEWFYPGDNFGQEFKVAPAQVAVAETATTEVAQPAPEEVTPAPEQPAPEEAAPAPEQPQAEQAQPAPEQPQAAPEQPAPTPTPAPEQPEQLPKTASTLPLVGLIGILSLGAAASLRLISKRSS